MPEERSEPAVSLCAGGLLRFVAVCPSGLEELLARELGGWGAAVTDTTPGAVLFHAQLQVAYRACLWSRFANRILHSIGSGSAHTADDIYGISRSIAWDEHFGVDATFAVHCTVDDAKVHNSHYAALRVKDGIADYFRERCGKRPSVSQEHPDIVVHVYINADKAIISIDLSGESLHVRGYRTEGAEAPLKETLAAGIVRLTGWPDGANDRSVLIDPMCGSGTLLIEAAMQFGGIAPGLGRRYYGFLKWRGSDRRIWNDLVVEAHANKEEALHAAWPVIVGYDASLSAVGAARRNIARAGLDKVIRVEHRELADFDLPTEQSLKGDPELRYIITNPPYGERLRTDGSEKYLYRCLGRLLKSRCSGWRAGVFTSSVELADALGMQPCKKHRLYNGPIPCRLYVYDVPEAKPEDAGPALRCASVSTGTPGAADFANRLRKNLHRISAWARGEGVSCFRVYDADLPDYNLAVDVYEQWLHVQEYAPPATIDPEKAERRLSDALAVIRETFAVGRDRVYIKRRQRQKGKRQYQKKEGGGTLYEVREGPCRFLVNLSDYLDTGLFLDHRTTRAMLRAAARGKRFLNLFGYTGTATVHAALGGARSSVTVDRSHAYCAWAQKNFALNGLGIERNTVILEDCMRWLAQCHDTFDLIFADPPTFSNRKGTPDVFDVQRDHVALIQAAVNLLAPDGLLIFSSNYRRFRLDLNKLERLHVQDITATTIPFDFKRSPRVHQCWEIRKQ